MCPSCSEIFLSCHRCDSVAAVLIEFSRPLAGWAPGAGARTAQQNSVSSPVYSGCRTESSRWSSRSHPQVLSRGKFLCSENSRRLQGASPVGPLSTGDREGGVTSLLLEVSQPSRVVFVGDGGERSHVSDEGPVYLFCTMIINVDQVNRSGKRRATSPRQLGPDGHLASPDSAPSPWAGCHLLGFLLPSPLPRIWPSRLLPQTSCLY